MDWLFLIFIAAVLLPAWGQSALESKRVQLMHKFERQRGSRVIVLIHRQEVMNFLGFPVIKYINIEDSERLLRAIHLTPPDMPLDIIVHTPGGLVLAAQQIAMALTRHHGKVTVFVPHYAMSGGTMIALAADEIVMDENAVLGPIDPQIGTTPAVSLLKLSESKPADKLSDEMLIMIDVARKAINQVESLMKKILSDHVPQVKVDPARIADISKSLVSGIWTHDHPIMFEDAQELGLPVKTGIPQEVYDLMDLYPQGPEGRGGVEYIQIPYLPIPKPVPAAPSVEK